MPTQGSTNLIVYAARWHPAILVILTLFFAICLFFGLVLVIRDAAAWKLLAVALGGLVLFGRAIFVKYEREIKENEERMRSLNS